jgi:TonB family protein
MKRLFVFALFFASLMHADVTVRLRTGMKALAAPAVPDETQEVRMKGDKGATFEGGATTIMDFAARKITIIDTARKKFVTMSAAEYEDQMAAAMPQFGFDAGAPEPAGKAKVESRRTGRTETILGVATEETETAVSMELPLTGGADAQKMGMRFVRQEWSATPMETLRVPAVHQLTGYNLWQEYIMGTALIKKMFPQGDSSLAEAFKMNPGALRWSMKMYMSIPGMDASAPLMEMNYEIVSLSTDAVDARFFEIPAGYAPATYADLMDSRKRDRQRASQTAVPAPKTVPGGIEAYVPEKSPLHEIDPALPEDARRAGVQGMVELLITLDPQGHVTNAEPLSGSDILRKAAVATVQDWTWRPVLRNGVAVSAYTNATVTYIDPSQGTFTPSITDLMAAQQRRGELEEALPRTPQQKLADIEEDSQGGDKSRRFYALGTIASTALAAGERSKAEATARELLAMAADFPKDWNYGNAIHDGHMTLGLIALDKNDIGAASRELLEAGRTPGSPQLDSFGPNMSLADALLKKGEKATVIEYLSACGTFWKMGQDRLKSWADTINEGSVPTFGVNLR